MTETRKKKAKKRTKKKARKKSPERPSNPMPGLYPPDSDESLLLFLSSPHWQLSIEFGIDEVSKLIHVPVVTIRQWLAHDLLASVVEQTKGRATRFNAVQIMQLSLLKTLSIYGLSRKVGRNATAYLSERLGEFYARGSAATHQPMFVCFYPTVRGWDNFVLRRNQQNTPDEMALDVTVRVDMDNIIKSAWFPIDAALRVRFGKEESKS